MLNSKCPSVVCPECCCTLHVSCRAHDYGDKNKLSVLPTLYYTISRALDGMITSCRCYTSCTGFWFESRWTSRQPPWSTAHCPTWLWLNWPLTVSCLKKVVANCVLPTQGLVSSDGLIATLGTDVSWLLAQGCGTTFQLVLGKRTSAMNSLSGW